MAGTEHVSKRNMWEIQYHFAEAGKHWPTDSPQLCMWGRGRDSVARRSDIASYLWKLWGFQTADQDLWGSGVVSVQLPSAKR